MSAVPARSASPPARIEIVVDVSIDMLGQLNDGQSRVDAMRRALAHVLLRMPADGGDGAVSLHLLGSERHWWSDDACGDVVEVPGEGGVDHARLIATLDALRPTGMRPVDDALRDIVDRTRQRDGPVHVVLVLGGDGDCPGDREALLDALESETDRIRVTVVGVAMPPAVARALTGVIPTRNAWTQGELAAQLEEVIRGADAREPRRRDVEIASPVTIPPELEGQLIGPDRQHPEVVRNDGTRIVGRVTPGRYTLQITTEEGDVVAARGPVNVAADRDVLLELPSPPPFPPSVELIPDRPVVGDTLWVRRWGDPAPGVEWTAAIARQEDPPGSWLVRAAPIDAAAEVPLVVPDPGRATLEARILEGPSAGPVAVVARRTLEPLRPAVLLDVPEQVETGTPLRIAWTGPDLEGDQIVMERTEPAEGGSTVCLPVTDDRGEVTVTAPREPGTYRARYLLGPVRATATVRTLELFEILARLEVPESAAAGAPVEIRWEGPAAPHDFLALAEAGAADDEYGPWSPTADGSPTVLEAPRAAGPWEVRYVDGASGRILARAPLEITELAVTLDAPKRVTAGTRFEVRWTGTPSPGDIVAVAPADAPAARILDWVSTDAGSPASLAAPFSPGAFEVRFLRPASREILASRPLEVTR